MHTIEEMIRRAPIPRASLAAEIGITERTLREYAARNRAPQCVRCLLAIYAGRVPWPEGRRLVYHRGALYRNDDDRTGLPLEEIAAYSFRLRELEHVRSELRRLKAAPAQYLLDLA